MMEDIGTVGEWAELARSQERGDDNCIPCFYMKPVQDRKESEKAGRPRFRDVPYVEIIVPGDKTNRPNRKVQDVDKTRWPQVWADFQRKQEATTTAGTPIEEWAYLKRTQVMEFKAIGIMTIEALAGLDDSGLEKIGIGARDLQVRARQHLQPQSETETELRERNISLEGEMKRQGIELEALKQQVENMAQPARRGPGRPRKESEAA